jgi:hypothetical protein
MRLRTHILTSALLGAALYPRSPLKAALLLAGGVGLDADHYLLYALRSGDWSPRTALHYDSWRHAPRSRDDTRTRYGSLRSMFHDARLTLPLIWGLARLWPALRPIAVGLTLHLALDFPFLRLDWRVWRRARGRCERCGRVGVKRSIHYIVTPQHGGARWSLDNRAAWCRACNFEVRGF